MSVCCNVSVPAVGRAASWVRVPNVKKKMLGQPMPAKLQINESGDEDEREAIRVAARVMDMPHGQREGSTAQSQPGPLALRRTAGHPPLSQFQRPLVS